MPVVPGDVDEYATTVEGDPEPGTVPGLYAALVTAVLAWLAVELAPKPGVPLPRWELELDPWKARRYALNEFAALEGRVRVAAGTAFLAVMARARTTAYADTRAPVVPGVPDVRGRVESLMSALRRCQDRVVGVVHDVYAEAVLAAGRATGDPLPEIQRILDRAADRGLTGFVDSAGRHWSLGTWVETTVRAHYADAALAEYVDTVRGLGVRLVLVGLSPEPCPRCVPWERRLLSLDGTPRGMVTVGSQSVDVAGTLGEARAAGLFHPWCRHRVVAWVPGRSRRIRAVREVPAKTRAWRRYVGRTARAWERRERVALTTDAKRRAAARVADWRTRRRTP